VKPCEGLVTIAMTPGDGSYGIRAPLLSCYIPHLCPSHVQLSCFVFIMCVCVVYKCWILLRRCRSVFFYKPTLRTHTVTTLVFLHLSVDYGNWTVMKDTKHNTQYWCSFAPNWLLYSNIAFFIDSLKVLLSTQCFGSWRVELLTMQRSVLRLGKAAGHGRTWLRSRLGCCTRRTHLAVSCV